MKIKTSAIFVLSALALPSHANECGEFTIADMNWNSASLIAHVDQFILNEGYGCDAQLIPGDSVPTGTSMIEKVSLTSRPNFGQTESKKHSTKA